MKRRLGTGGMGTVYLAEETGLGQPVAVKFLSHELSSQPQMVRRFLNEAKTYARVQHPHAVHIYDFGQEPDGAFFIVMEFVEGKSLKAFLEERGRLPAASAIEIALQVCDALEHAHSQGVVHRDLKPENIMVTERMRGLHATVLDFGISRLVAEDETRLTAAGSTLGSPRYMAPEQATGTEVSHRADIYSLALIAFEMLAGRHPFSATTNLGFIEAQVRKPLPRFSELNVDVPEAVEAVLRRAAAKRPEERFSSMADFATALTAVAPTMPQGPAVGATTVQMSAGAKPVSHKALLWALALVAASGASLAAVRLVDWPDDSPTDPPLALHPSPSPRRLGPAPAALADPVRPRTIEPPPQEQRLPVPVPARTNDAEPPSAAKLAVNDTGPRSPPKAKPAPARPAVPLGTGSVRIVSLAEGKSIWAAVSVDGKRLSELTPLVLELRAGKHQLAVERSGYLGAETEVQVDEGKTTIVRLELTR
ncbi:MAG: serine/threonine-protein kinase [Myxococcaceae bacterium]